MKNIIGALLILILVVGTHNGNKQLVDLENRLDDVTTNLQVEMERSAILKDRVGALELENDDLEDLVKRLEAELVIGTEESNSQLAIIEELKVSNANLKSTNSNLEKKLVTKKTVQPTRSKVSREKSPTIKAKTPSTPVAKSKPTKSTNTQVATQQGDKRLLGTFQSTAYDLSVASTGKRPGDKGYGITASGMKAGPGVVAVDPKVIPLGTKLFIEGYGNAIAGDTGSAIKGNIIDVFFSSNAKCMSWGRRSVKVWIRE